MFDQCDESCDTPKPLLVAVQELGDISKDMVATLQEAGYNDDGYNGKEFTFFTTRFPENASRNHQHKINLHPGNTWYDKFPSTSNCFCYRKS